MKRFNRLLGGILTVSLAAIAFMGMAPTQIARAAPAVYTVNLLSDPGDGTCDIGTCTLRDAILAANATVDADTIVFSVNGTITLSPAQPPLIISKDLTIDGSGRNVTISGGSVVTVFTVNNGVSAILKAITIQDGNNSLSGGGVINNGSLTVAGSTFIGNHAHAGGAISNNNALVVYNSTFSGNTADTFGGGIQNASGTVTLYNNTFSANGAVSGGGLYIAAGATLNYTNNIIANSASGGDCVTAGIVSVNANNLAEDGSCFAGMSGDPKLGSLANNGGPTQTFKLLAESPARDAGSDTDCAAAPVSNLDQRGVTRPLGPHCDIGSYEAAFIPVVNLNPKTLIFGEQLVGTTSAAKSVVLTYTGSGSLVIGALGVSGEFALVAASDTCSGKTLSVNQQCSFSVTFSPMSSGAKTGTVTIPSNAVSSPDSVPLTGAGIVPEVGLSATSLRFAAQFIGTTSATQIVTVTNIGTGKLKIGTLRISGDFSLRANNCNGAVLPALGSCTFGVAFSPIEGGKVTGTVVIPSNAPTSPSRVGLRGSIKAGKQLLLMGNFDTIVVPVPWIVSSPSNSLVNLRDCSISLSPLCSAKFIGSRQNPTLSALQMVTRAGAAGDKFYIGLSSRASNVPSGGQYKSLVSFYNGNGLVGSQTLTFSNGTHDFQTLGVTYTVPAAYTRILFNFTYQKTGGVAWFDNAVLILLP